MKFVTVPDVHGRNTWQKAVYRFDDNGNVVDCLLGKEIDKVIFVGDYVDSWDLTNTEILANLVAIINLKKDYPEYVELLWGNHDVAYLNMQSGISGFRAVMAPDLYQLFNDNRGLFKLAYQYKTTIWTHAGIHKGWWQYNALPVIEGKKIVRWGGFLDECKNIADYLNVMFDFNFEDIYMVSHHRGGYNKVAGPIWADKVEIYTKPLGGYHQIVGHTPVPYPKTYDFFDLTKVTFVDCMEHNDTFYKLTL